MGCIRCKDARKQYYVKGNKKLCAICNISELKEFWKCLIHLKLEIDGDVNTCPSCDCWEGGSPEDDVWTCNSDQGECAGLDIPTVNFEEGACRKCGILPPKKSPKTQRRRVLHHPMFQRFIESQAWRETHIVKRECCDRSE